MKRALLALSLLFALSGPQVFADPNTGGSSEASYGSDSKLPQGITVIPTLGVSIFSVKGSDVGSASNTTGFTGGLLADFDLTQRFKIETGILYLQEGAGGSGFTLTDNYLAIPILAKYNIIDSSGSSLHVKGGVAPAILTSSKISAGDFSADTSSLVNSFDLQALAGIGGTIATTNKMGITLDVMFDRGLFTVASGSSAYNQGFIITAGLSF